MLVNYTPLKRLRSDDPHAPYHSGIPDRATLVYSQKVRETQKQLLTEAGENPTEDQRPIVLGGVEASLRRFTHYDYWDNKVRRPLLFDAKADIIVYGSGEHQIVEIARRLDSQQSLQQIEGTCIISKDLAVDIPSGSYEMLPSFEEVIQDKVAYCKMQLQFSNEKTIVQPVGDRYLIQYQMYEYTSEDLDWVYSLPFTYNIPEEFKEFEMAKFSIITHRGCFGNCNFCSIALHQGCRIISRSQENILVKFVK